MSSRFFLFLFFTFSCTGAIAQTGFELAVQQLLSKPEYKNASVGIHILNQQTGEEMYGLNAHKVLIPASTMKLISSATALEVLGEQYRFRTQIGYTGKIKKDGILEGDLVVIGGADPALGSEYFEEHYHEFMPAWAKAVKKAGINRVNGNLVLDASLYDGERIPNTWIWGDMGNYYGVGPHAFTIYDNLFRITFSSPKKAGRKTIVIATYPKIDGLSIQNEVLSDDISFDNAYVFGGPFDKTRIIRGAIPRNRDAFTIKAAIHQPEEIVAQTFFKALADEGVFVSRDVHFKQVSQKDFRSIYTQESPSLEQIAEVLNHESVNLFAEHFLKQLALEKSGRGDREEAITLTKEYWESRGISCKYLFMHDGSGLSHFNAVSPFFFTSFLQKVHPNRSFVNSLPQAGEGTLKRFNSELFPGNTLQAKSGSMTRVRCYSGYLKSDSGKQLTFSLMFNHFSGSHSALIKEIEQLFVEMRRSW